MQISRLILYSLCDMNLSSGNISSSESFGKGIGLLMILLDFNDSESLVLTELLTETTKSILS